MPARYYPFFVFVVAVVLRLPSLFVPYYNIDEITNALFGHFLLDGDMKVEDFLGSNYMLTFFVYTVVLELFGRDTLFGIHLVHMVWVGLTALALHGAGTELTGNRKGGLACGLFYGLFSITFFAKDFQSALSESFSLLPSTLAAWLFFKGLREKKGFYFLAIGFFIGIASLFKAPAGILILPVILTLLIADFKRAHFYIVPSLVGLGLTLASQFLLAPNPWEAARTALQYLLMVNEVYIQAYDLPFTYWISKLLIRTCLVMAASLALWYLALLAVRKVLFQKDRKDVLAIFFLVLWVIAEWFVVSLGKRVFFHYFVFLFPPLCLLAAYATTQVDLKKIRGYPIFCFFTVLSVCVFLSDGIFRWSLDKKDFLEVQKYITETTKSSDRIYIWGLVPQIYFFSERKPASTIIWADLLAGFSPGSAAMEYMRATGTNLEISSSIKRDLRPLPDMSDSGIRPLVGDSLRDFEEHELLSVKEVVEKIDSPPWKKFLQEVLKNPPILFLDTSPTGVRGFSHYPIDKYPLLKRFLEDNYTFKVTLQNIHIYRLKFKN